MTALAETVGQPKGGRTFSEVYDILRCFDEMSDLASDDFCNAQERRFASELKNSDFNLDGPVFDMLQANFQFSDEYGAFFDELSLVLKLFAMRRREGPQVDFLAMRVLFHAGRILERLRVEGKNRSDRPTKAGSTKWKNKITPQEVIEELYRTDTNGKKKGPICREIRDAFIKRGKKEKDVYSTRHIDRILKDEWFRIL